MTVFLSDEQDEPADLASLRSLAEAVLVAERIPADAELAVMLVTADQISEYNKRFMGHTGPTDVLAFPVDDLQPGEPPESLPNGPPVVLGDVFLCPSEITSRAHADSLEPAAFLDLLLVHGILHLLGYDHDDEATARRMEAREEEIITNLGRALP